MDSVVTVTVDDVTVDDSIDIADSDSEDESLVVIELFSKLSAAAARSKLNGLDGSEKDVAV